MRLASYFSCFAALSLAACEDNLLIYAGEQGIRQGSLILKSRPVEDVITDPRTPDKIRKYLNLSQELLTFAKQTAGIDPGKSYQRYLHLNRTWVTQTLVAARRDRLELVPFKFPVLGELPYKGFFNEEDAILEKRRLEKLDLDVYRGFVPAYSSLGWFADPIYNTMFQGEAYFINLLLHELTHLSFYFPDHAEFNEAFATWFAQRMSAEFVAYSKQIENKPLLLQRLLEDDEQDHSISVFSQEAIRIAEDGYRKSLDRSEIFKKVEALAASKVATQHLNKHPWNNARILSLSTYYRLIPAIDHYAKTKELDPIKMLHFVRKSGPSIVPSIISRQ